MIDFAHLEGKSVPELNPVVYQDIQMFKELTGAFVTAQKALESNLFGVGSKFIGHFATIHELLQRFPVNPEVLAIIENYIAEFKNEYQVEWDVFILMTYLNPSVQWMEDRQYDEESARRIRAFLVEKVGRKLMTQTRNPPGPPPEGDYITYWPLAEEEVLAVEAQIERYDAIRTTGQAKPLAFWTTPPPELRLLASVALEVLSLLATSASVERAFSVARHICGDFQMAMLPETIATRVMIRANWDLGDRGTLTRILRLGRVEWKRRSQEIQRRKDSEDNHWRIHLVPRTHLVSEDPLTDPLAPDLEHSDGFEDPLTRTS
jgi:hypothetical protein